MSKLPKKDQHPERKVSVVLALLLVFLGIKFTSVGVGFAHLYQDDGYNVTGGIMTLIGGLIIGYIIGVGKKDA
jgi:hypothetical protein